MEKLGEFLSKFAGLIIGALVGVILIATELKDAILNLIIIVACAYLGKYIQQNGKDLKMKIKNLIEKW
jgi:uncharacterized membrane protein